MGKGDYLRAAHPLIPKFIFVGMSIDFNGKPGFVAFPEVIVLEWWILSTR